MPQIDVYRLSRLAFAEVTGWQRMLKELRRDRKYAFLGYAPLRKGCIRLLGSSDRSADEGIRADITSESKDAAWVLRNLSAYDVFKAQFAPSLAACDEVFMGRWGEFAPLSFAGDVELTGGPHFSACDTEGRGRFIYLHPSTNWTDKERDAFCELLCYVVKERFGSGHDDVWFLDLVNARRVAYRPKKRVLARCKTAAELLFGTLATE